MGRMGGSDQGVWMASILPRPLFEALIWRFGLLSGHIIGSERPRKALLGGWQDRDGGLEGLLFCIREEVIHSIRGSVFIIIADDIISLAR